MNIRTLLLLSLLAMPLQAADVDVVNPEAVGFTSDRLSRISDFVDREIAAGNLVGAVTLVARHGQVVLFESTGRYGLEDNRPMDKDALFRIQMTIEQLMTHTAGLTNGWHLEHPVERAYRDAALYQSADLDAFIDKLATLPLRFEPGTRYHYSVATDVLGALVERLSGQTLEKFFQARIFDPLDMHDSFFNVPESKVARLAGGHLWNAERQLMEPMPAGLLPPPSGVTLFSGGGGLISTARDYWRFCEMLRQGGSLDGVRILGPKTVQAMTMARLTPQVRNNGATEYPASHLYPGQSFGLGAGVITDPAQAQVISSKGEYSWGGIANTKFWIDPEEDLIVVFMSQVMGTPHSDRHRFDLKVATYQALTELGGSGRN
ncbi:MAG: class A beta-lactamase-related serine hydrolase [Gammaproteobacteria bacterium]|nr:class A beta-lactamase-related serine hydrolase [Gammaproteobacteria bacterium]